MWSKKQVQKFQTPNYSKEYFRRPVILKEIGPLNGKKVLEIGCGSGYWTRIFTKKGAICTGIDIVKDQISLAKRIELEKPLGIKYFVKDATNLRQFKGSTFDIVLFEFVLLEIADKKTIAKIIKEVYRVIKKRGVIFISDMHPFDPILDKRFKLQKSFNYFSSGGKIICGAKQLDGSTIEFVDYHWTIEDLVSFVLDGGFRLTKLLEPQIPKELVKKIPYFKYRIGIPKEIIIIGKK